MGMTAIRRWRGEEPGKALSAKELFEQEAESNKEAKAPAKKRATKKDGEDA